MSQNETPSQVSFQNNGRNHAQIRYVRQWFDRDDDLHTINFVRENEPI